MSPSAPQTDTARQNADGVGRALIDAIGSMDLPAKIVLAADDDFDDWVQIHAVYALMRGRGDGRTTMRAVLERADRLGVTLTITPRSAKEFGWGLDGQRIEDGLGQEALETWYRKMGFEWIDAEDDGRMWRPARSHL